MEDRLVILDRDGVINFDSVDYIKSPDEWVPIPGSIDAIVRLYRAGYRVYVATNQAGIGRGILTRANLEAIHERLVSTVRIAGGEIAGIQFCPHHPDDQCNCRKPRPGMLLAIEEASGVAVRGKPFVGDSISDLRAAEAAGCEPILVLTGNGTETARLDLPTARIFEDLAAFADTLLTGDI